MTRSAEECRQGILDAIARARVAARRMVLAENLADDTGVQIAFQAILHNLSVIADAVTAMPPEVLEQDPATPWSEIAAMTDLIDPTYHRIVPTDVRDTVEAALDPLESAVLRLKVRP